MRFFLKNISTGSNGVEFLNKQQQITSKNNRTTPQDINAKPVFSPVTTFKSYDGTNYLLKYFTASQRK